MCLLCGDAAHIGIAITHRPAQILGGLWWRGTFSEAAANAIHPVILTVKSFSDGRDAVWKSPIVGLSRHPDSDRFAYFVGIAVDGGESLPAGFETLELSEMAFASSWHGPDDGDVVAHYGRMIEWLRTSGHRLDTSRFTQREEYPHDVDLSLPPALRLLLPVSFPES